MKINSKIFSAVILCIITTALMTGCIGISTGVGKESVDIEGSIQLPTISYDLTFSNGTDDWATVIKLSKDGSFTGDYHISDMNNTDADYPDGTVYRSKFTGKFTNIEKVDENTYKMELQTLELEKPEGEEFIEDNIRYVSAEPYGLEIGEKYTLYTSEKETADLSEEFLSWWPYKESEEGKLPEKLLCFGLCNEETQYGFFTYQ